MVSIIMDVLLVGIIVLAAYRGFRKGIIASVIGLVSLVVAIYGANASGKSNIVNAFLNFQQEGISEKFRTDIALMDMQTKQPFSDKIRLIYLQLPLFTKEVSECENQFERWIYVLKNMEKLNRYPFEIKDKVFKKLIETCDVASWTREERIKYDRALKHFRDTIAVMEGQKQEGIKEGEKKGREEERLAIARSLKNDGIPVNVIARNTGLSVEEISNL